MKNFVIGDIHGGYRALLQCLERSNFNYDEDKLVVLGDVADGWSEVPEAFEELFKIRNLIYVRGNHDQWLKDFLLRGKQPDIWTLQGGSASRDAYLHRYPQLMQSHRDFLKKTKCYYVDEENRVFVHGGIKWNFPVEATDKMWLMWDRELWDNRHQYEKVPMYSEVFVGHTSIWNFSHNPLNRGNVWFLDTGGGWEGKLTIMDIESKEFWQSDKLTDLYPNERGRN